VHHQVKSRQRLKQRQIQKAAAEVSQPLTGRVWDKLTGSQHSSQQELMEDSTTSDISQNNSLDYNFTLPIGHTV